MKKLFLTVTFLLGMTFGAFAEWNSYEQGWFLFNLFNSNEEGPEAANDGLFENDEINQILWENVVETPSFGVNYEGGGMFGRGKTFSTGMGDGFRNIGMFSLPTSHGDTGDATAPLGTGVVVLLGMGAAYLVAKRRKE